MKPLTTFRLMAVSSVAGLAVLSASASAQDIRLNYERLSSFEEPLAFEVGAITVEVEGLIDAPLVAEFDNLADSNTVDAGIVANGQISAQVQLPNRWRVGVAYFGQYATDEAALFDNQEGYSDNVAGFIGTSFGTLLGGNVNGQVREITRRQRGVGNGFLAFDDFYGGLANWGGAYVGRFGPSVIGAVVDENGDFEVGAVFQRPLGERDYRFSGRVRSARFLAADGITEFGSTGAGLVGELVYGSTIFDLGAGYERLDGELTDFDRWFLSAGAQTQLGPLRLSGETHFGQAAGQDEFAAALGASYDVARGLSVNLGLNHEEAEIISDGIVIQDTDEIKAVGSVRFNF